MEYIEYSDSGWLYANSKLAAAAELARRPEAQNSPSLQDKICRSYGIFLDSMTDDEISEFENLIKSLIERK